MKPSESRQTGPDIKLDSKLSVMLKDKIPIVIFVGPQKTGTTYIYDVISQDRNVNISRAVKEIFFFDRYFHLGLDWYSKHFSNSQQMIDFSPSIFSDQEALNNVFQTFPDALIIVTVRNPVERSWSHYQHLRRYGYTADSLVESCKKFPEIIEGSRYSTYISKWKERFGDQNVKVLRFDDLKSDTSNFVNTLKRFITFDASPEFAVNRNYAQQHRSKPLIKMARSVANFLRRYRIYFFINVLKKIGINYFLFKDSSERITESEQRFLEGLLKDEVDIG